MIACTFLVEDCCSAIFPVYPSSELIDDAWIFFREGCKKFPIGETRFSWRDFSNTASLSTHSPSSIQPHFLEYDTILLTLALGLADLTIFLVLSRIMHPCPRRSRPRKVLAETRSTFEVQHVDMLVNLST
jgi:hypothetical protein